MNIRDEFHRNMKVASHNEMAAAVLTLAGAIVSCGSNIEIKLVSDRNNPLHLNVGTDSGTDPIKIRQPYG